MTATTVISNAIPPPAPSAIQNAKPQAATELSKCILWYNKVITKMSKVIGLYDIVLIEPTDPLWKRVLKVMIVVRFFFWFPIISTVAWLVQHCVTPLFSVLKKLFNAEFYFDQEPLLHDALEKGRFSQAGSLIESRAPEQLNTPNLWGESPLRIALTQASSAKEDSLERQSYLELARAINQKITSAHNKPSAQLHKGVIWYNKVVTWLTKWIPSYIMMTIQASDTMWKTVLKVVLAIPMLLVCAIWDFARWFPLDSQKMPDNNRAVSEAIHLKEYEIAQDLIDRAPINEQSSLQSSLNKSLWDALSEAIRWKNNDHARDLIQRMSTPQLSTLNERGETFLHIAAEANYGEIIPLLASKMTPEARVHQDADGNTALYSVHWINDTVLPELIKVLPTATWLLKNAKGERGFWKALFALCSNHSEIAPDLFRSILKSIPREGWSLKMSPSEFRTLREIQPVAIHSLTSNVLHVLLDEIWQTYRELTTILPGSSVDVNSLSQLIEKISSIVDLAPGELFFMKDAWNRTPLEFVLSILQVPAFIADLIQKRMQREQMKTFALGASLAYQRKENTTVGRLTTNRLFEPKLFPLIQSYL